MPLTPSQIGARLKDARTRHGLSKAEVARRINVDTATVYRWENGAQRIKAANLVALSELYGEPLEGLVAERASGGAGSKSAADTPGRLAEPRSPAYAALTFGTPIEAQRSRLWLEGLLLQLAEAGPDADFLQRLIDGASALLPQPEKGGSHPTAAPGHALATTEPPAAKEEKRRA